MNDEIVITFCKDTSVLAIICETIADKLLSTESVHVVKPKDGQMPYLAVRWTFVPFSKERVEKWKVFAEGFKSGVRFEAAKTRALAKQG